MVKNIIKVKLLLSLIFIIILIPGCVSRNIETLPNDNKNEKISEVEKDGSIMTPISTQSINPFPDYYWEMKVFRKEGSEFRINLFFENKGNIDLMNVKIKYEFYTYSGNFYSERKYELGNVTSGKIVKMAIAFPNRKPGTETWSNMKMFLSYNGESYKEEKIKGSTNSLKIGDLISKAE